MGTARLWSVGHSNHSFERFVNVVAGAGIGAVADVRSVPRSAYSPHFDRAPLRRSLVEAGLGYVFLGDELGGRPPEGYYDDEGHVRYDLVSEAPFFQAGLGRLLRGAERFNVAMMCSEESPHECHRRLLISRVLEERHVDVVHIRADGTLQREQDLVMAERAQQLSILEEDVRPWRSIRSVSPSGGPGSSSGD